MKIVRKSFKNGLRSIVVPMEGTKTVTVLVLIGTGSNNQTFSNNGISHFLEHMFFKGTKNYPKPGTLDRMLDAIGAMNNAFTSRDITGYWIKVDSKYSDTALHWVSEILQNALLKEDEINRERTVILEENNMRMDNPMRHIGTIFESLLFGNNPYGWDIIGTQKNIMKMKRSAFLKYWKSQYVASNTVVIVAGDIKEDSVTKKIEESFKNLRTGNFVKAPEPKKIVPGPRMFIQQKNTAQTHLLLGTAGFSLNHKDRLAAEILATILGGYMSSRLFSEIRERHGLAYVVQASHDSYKKVGYFRAYAGMPHDKALEVTTRVIANLHRVKHSGVTSEELSRAKENIKGHLAISLESTDHVAAFVGEQELLLGRITLPEDLIKKIDKVSKNDIKRVAKNLFRKDKVFLVLIGPHLRKEPYEKILQDL